MKINDLTVFIITTGQNINYLDCIRSLQNQSCSFKVNIIREYSPLSVAFQEMLNRCTTPYFVQVDEDMVLNSDAIEILYKAITTQPKYAMVCCYLHDVHYNINLMGIKIYNHKIFKQFPYNLNHPSCEVEQLNRITQSGYKWLANSEVVGLHSPKWTSEEIFNRYNVLVKKQQLLNGSCGFGNIQQTLLNRVMHNFNALDFFALLGANSALTHPHFPSEKNYKQSNPDYLVYEQTYSELVEKHKQLNILFLYDVDGWVFDFETRAYKLYSSHNIIRKKFDKVTRTDLKNIDILIIPGSCHYKCLQDRGLISFAQEQNVKIVVQYNSEIELDLPRYLTKCDLAVASSPDIYNRLKNKQENLRFIPHFIDTHYWEDTSDNNTFKIGWAGNPECKVKNFDLLKELNFPVQIQSNYGKQFFNSNRTLQEMKDFYKDIGILLILSESEGTPMPCVTPDTDIILKNQIQKISKIKIGDEILTHTGKFQKVSNIFNRNINEMIYEIKTYGNIDTLKITQNHPVLSIKRPLKKSKKGMQWEVQEPQWIPAKDLKKGDAVCFPIIKSKDCPEKIDLIAFDSFKRFNICYNSTQLWYKTAYPIIKYNRFIEINDDLAKLIGYFIAEGSLSKSSIKLSFHSKETIYHNEVRNLLQKIFNSTVRFELIENHKSLAVYGSGRIIKDFFLNTCYTNLLNHTAHTKKIPDFILYNKNTSLLKNCYEGYFNGDGCKFNRRIMATDTVSKQLAFDLKILITRLGFKATIYTQPPRKKIIQKQKESNCARIYKVFFNTIAQTQHSNKTWINLNQTYQYNLIKSIDKKLYLGDIYNLEVENDNSYTTTSCSIHNCLEAMASGKVVISTNTGLATELLPPEFIIDKQKNIIEQVNNVLDNLKNNPEKLITIGKENRKKVTQKNDWFTNVLWLDRIYANLYNKHPKTQLTKKIKVVQLARIPCANSGYYLSQLLNNYSDKFESRYILGSDYSTKHTDIVPFRKFPTDLFWQTQKEECIKAIQEADIVHIHHGFWGETQEIQDLIKTKKVITTVYDLSLENNGVYYNRKNRLSDLITIANQPAQKRVFTQWSTTYVPLVNCLFDENIQKNNSEPIIVYAPTNRYPITNSSSKGYNEVLQIINNLKKQGLKFTFDLIEGVSHKEDLNRKRKADIIIDDIVNDTFHNTSIYAACFGAIAITGHSSPEFPFIYANLNTLEETLKHYILNPTILKAEQKKLTLWREKNYTPQKLLFPYEEIYQNVLKTQKKIPIIPSFHTQDILIDLLKLGLNQGFRICLLQKSCLEIIKHQRLSDSKHIWVGITLNDQIQHYLLNNGFQPIQNTWIKNNITIHVLPYPNKTKPWTIQEIPTNVPLPVIGYLENLYGKNWER
jgi:glycosyltransferase involved in cell wall biosynthesis